MKNCKFVIGIFLALYTTQIKAQTIQYNYDRNGSCIQRKLYVCPNCPNTQRTTKPSDETVAPVDTTSHYVIGVFPNPTQNVLNINVTNIESTDNIDLYLNDELGKQLLNLKKQPSITTINMANYKSGVYYLQVVIEGDKPRIYKIIKLE